MVRIKHRYLLFNILYPEAATSDVKTTDPPYLAFHAPSPGHLTGGLVLNALRASIAAHFGDVGVGLASASLKVVYFSPATSTSIVRCPRQHFRLVWAALTYMTEVPGTKFAPSKKCVVQVVRASGTIRKSEEELLRRTKRDIVRVKEWEEGAAEDTGILARLLAANAPSESQQHLLDETLMSIDEDDDMSE